LGSGGEVKEKKKAKRMGCYRAAANPAGGLQPGLSGYRTIATH